MSEMVVLYDLACRGHCACWSPNVWKSRLVLNYKGIPYRTEWVEHLQIAPTLERLGIEPSSGPGSAYTIPAIQLPDGMGVMDSAAIAAKLEALYPKPSLHLHTGLHEKIGPILGQAAGPLVPVFMPKIGRSVLKESSVEWFQEARAQRFGMSLDELEKIKGGDQAWAAAAPGLEQLNRFVSDHKIDNGPFVLGSQVSYVDFVIASMVESLRRISEMDGGDMFERFTGGNEDLKKLHQACQRWLKDDQ